MFRKKWNDPVWSKVIATGIIGVITLLYNLVISLIHKESFKSEFMNFWTLKIDLWLIALLVVFASIIFLISQNSFRYNDETIKQDRLLFNNIRFENCMPDFFLEIKGHGFSSRPISSERISTLIDFLEDSKRSDFEFFHPRIEKLKKELVEEFIRFDSVINNYIFGTDIQGPTTFVSIPREWEYDQPERLKKAREEIKVQEDKLTKTFQIFITQGRKILSV